MSLVDYQKKQRLEITEFCAVVVDRPPAMAVEPSKFEAQMMLLDIKRNIIVPTSLFGKMFGK